MASPVAGPSREFRRTFYAGKAPSTVRSPIVQPPNRFNAPPSWNEIDRQEGKKVPRNVKHPLTSASYAPDRLYDPELRNRPAVPSRFQVHTWLQTDTGREYKDPQGRGPKWLGRANHPFPLNPSFKPPPPHADELRQRIYNRYKKLLEEGYGAEAQEARHGIRAEVSRPRFEQPLLSSQDEAILRELGKEYDGLSLDRLRAMIRLKAFEEQREKQGKAPQKHFQDEMERYLGAPLRPELARDNVSKVDGETFAASEKVTRAVQPVLEMLNSEGGEKSLIELLKPAPSQQRRRRERPLEQDIPLRREGVSLSYCDTTDTPKGRAWERTNMFGKSRSPHARRAAINERYASLGRLPRELFGGKDTEHMRPLPESPAQWF